MPLKVYQNEGITALSQAIPTAIQAYYAAEDRDLKRKELAAKLAAQEENKRIQNEEAANKKANEDRDYQLRREEFEYKKSDEYRQQREMSDPYGLKALAAMKARDEYEAKQKEKTPQGKVEKLSSAEKQRFDNVTMGLNALNDLETAYKSQNREGSGGPLSLAGNADMMRIPFRGDTDYTAAADRWSEAIGRMQSGGAISKDEEKRFLRLVPSAFDSPQVAQQKIDNLKMELSSRLRNFGVSEDQAAELGYLKPRGMLGSQGMIQPTQPVQPIQQSQPQEQYNEETIINGERYKKVKGGWQKVRR